MPEYIEREALIQDAEDVLTWPMLDRINRQPTNGDRNDLISRSALIANAEPMHDHFGEGHLAVDIKHIIDAPPVDPVVRCGKCINRFNWNNGCGVCRMIGQNMNDTDFCSYGQRKDGAE